MPAGRSCKVSSNQRDTASLIYLYSQLFYRKRFHVNIFTYFCFNLITKTLKYYEKKCNFMCIGAGIEPDCLC
jgi:hypothetical protein